MRVGLSFFMQSNIEAFSTEEDEEYFALYSLTFEPNPQYDCSSTRHAGSRAQKQESFVITRDTIRSHLNSVLSSPMMLSGASSHLS